MDTGVTCGSAPESELILSRNLLVTSIAFVATRAGSDDDGCDLRLTTDNGSNGVTNSTMNIPDTNAGYSVGDVFSATVGTEIAAGTPFEIQVQDGSFCSNGSACQCDAGHVEGHYELWGILM